MEARDKPSIEATNEPNFNPRDYSEDDLCRLLMPLTAQHLRDSTGSTDADQDVGEVTLMAIRAYDPNRSRNFISFFLTRVRQRSADLARSRRPRGLKYHDCPRPIPKHIPDSLAISTRNTVTTTSLWDCLRRIDLMPPTLARCVCLGIVLGEWSKHQSTMISGTTPEEVSNVLAHV